MLHVMDDIIIFVHLVKFDCFIAKKNVKSNYNELTNLPIDSILAELFAKDVITSVEKETIEKTLPLKSKKMEYFLDNIINPSLANNVTVKFKAFLEVMEQSGDPLLINMANKLGMYLFMQNYIIFTSAF